MSRRLVASAAAPLLVGSFGVLPSSVDPVDQAAAEAAVAVFNERQTAAGWTSTGPFAQGAGDDDSDDSESEDSESEESEFGPCLGGFERYLDYTDVHLEGETARAFSDEFELTGGERADGVGEFGYAGAVVLTAEASAVVMFDEFVQRLGADSTAACMTGQLAEATPTDAPAIEIGVTTDGDLGVGEASARLDVAVTMDHQGSSYGTSATFAAARVDRSLVVVVAGGSGPAAASLDPVAELAAVVDTFS
jgi:hypothetical protein